MKLQKHLENLETSQDEAKKTAKKVTQKICDVLTEKHVNIKALCSEVGITPNIFYYHKRKGFFSLEIINKILKSYVFQGVDI